MPLENYQLNLFENENPKHKDLMKIIDFIQKKEGQSKIKLASQDLRKRWKMKHGLWVSCHFDHFDKQKSLLS